MPRIGEPLFLAPLPMEKVWGGNRLGKLFGKALPPGKIIGESWELVDRPEAQSVVDGGPYAGWTLRKLMEERAAELLGAEIAARKPPAFPLLAKYVDAGEPLSVQVHPDDAGARKLGYLDRGKCECWVVVHVDPGSRITRSLNPGVTRAQFEAALAAKRLDDVLLSFEPKVGDVIALAPGTIHAIGPGIVVAEIQQNSDLTFRVWDYNRVGLDGKPRPMHVKESLETIAFDAAPSGFFKEDMGPATVTGRAAGAGAEALLDGRYFNLVRRRLAAGSNATLGGRTGAPIVLMALAGAGTLAGRELRAGQTVLVPADRAEAAAKVQATSGELIWLESTPTPDA